MRRPPEEPLSLPALREVDTTPRMRIGEVAARLGLSLRSVRYYEEEGLVEASGRTPGGFRLYSELDVQRLLLIMAMRPLDYSIEDIRRFLAAIDALRTPAAEARRQEATTVLDEFAEDTDRRWASLRKQMDIARGFRSYLNKELDAVDPADRRTGRQP